MARRVVEKRILVILDMVVEDQIIILTLVVTKKIKEWKERKLVFFLLHSIIYPHHLNRMDTTITLL